MTNIPRIPSELIQLDKTVLTEETAEAPKTIIRAFDARKYLFMIHYTQD